MKIRKEQITNYVFYIITFLLFILDYIISFNYNNSIIVNFTFLLIGLLSIFLFIKSQEFISIDKMIYLFIFIFAYLAPYHQYSSNSSIHGYILFQNKDYIYANLLILVFVLLYYFFRKKSIVLKPKKNNKSNNSKFFLTNNNIFISTLISITCIVLLILEKQLIMTTSNVEIDTISSIIYKIERFFPIAILLIFIYCKKNNLVKAKNYNLYLIINLIISAIIFFPLNGAVGRFILLSVYLMIISSAFYNSRNKWIIILLVFLGFYIVFPTLNFFKYHTIREISQIELIGFQYNYIDFDAYEMFLTTIKSVSKYGILYGGNIISSLLAFIPRSFIPFKLEHSGIIVSSNFNFPYTNLSCPLFAEFYLAFGIIGVILLTPLFARFITKIYDNKDKNVLSNGIYFITTGIIFAFMRGAMLPVTSTWMILTLCYYLIYKILKILK